MELRLVKLSRPYEGGSIVERAIEVADICLKISIDRKAQGGIGSAAIPFGREIRGLQNACLQSEKSSAQIAAPKSGAEFEIRAELALSIRQRQVPRNDQIGRYPLPACSEKVPNANRNGRNGCRANSPLRR